MFLQLAYPAAVVEKSICNLSFLIFLQIRIRFTEWQNLNKL